MAASSLTIKNWPKFDSTWYIVWRQKIQMKFKIKDIWKIMYGKGKESTTLQETNAIIESIPTNQAIILT